MNASVLLAMFYSAAEPSSPGRLHPQSEPCAVPGGACRGSQSDSEYEHTVSLDMAENRAETFRDTCHSVSVHGLFVGVSRNNVLNCGVVYGSVEAIKI